MKRWSRVAGAAAIVVALAVLMGWGLEIAVLKSILPGLATMKVNTALAFAAAGVGLWLLQSATTNRRLVMVRRGCAVFLVVLGLATLVEYGLNLDMGIDQLLVRDGGVGEFLYPGRMSQISALNFVLLGAALLLLDVYRRYRVAQFVVLAASMFALLAFVGYVYGVEPFYRIFFYSSIALHTSVAFLVLCAGLLFASSDKGWMATVTGENAGGILARRLLPAAVIMPIVLGWIRLAGEHAGLYDPSVGLALSAISNIVVLTALILWSARALERFDAARYQAEEKLRELNTELEERVLERTAQLTEANGQLTRQVAEREQAEAKLRTLFEVLPVGISILDHDRNILETNPALEQMLGISKQGIAAGEYEARKYLCPDGTALPLHTLPSVRALQEQQPILNIEMGVVMESGKTLWTSVSAAPLPLSDAGVVVVTTDISERRWVEAALAEERDLLQALMDNVPDAIYFKDCDSRFTRVNRAQARNLGLSDPYQAIGKTDADFQGEPLSAEFYAEEQNLFQTGTPVVDRREFSPTPEGEPRWLAATKVPLRDKQGQIVGLIGISRNITQRIEVEEALVQSNAQLIERVQEISLLNELEAQLQTCVAIEEVYQVTAQLVSRLFPVEAGALYVINNSRNRMEATAVWGNAPAAPKVLQLTDCWAIRRVRVHISGIGYPNLVCPHLKGVSPSFSICIPLMAQGETLGCLHLNTPAEGHAGAWNGAKQQLAGVVADCIALAMANLNLREKLRQQSIRDALTDLFNRRYMEESLERELRRAARNGSSVGIVMLDVDHFKRVNDAYGHDTGDAVLRQLAYFLKKYTRGGDIACRFGGEEFTLILPDATLEEIGVRAEQLRHDFKAMTLEYGDKVIDAVTLSIGVAAYPNHGDTGAEVLRAADAALYRAKHEGRDRVVVSE